MVTCSIPTSDTFQMKMFSCLYEFETDRYKKYEAIKPSPIRDLKYKSLVRPILQLLAILNSKWIRFEF